MLVEKDSRIRRFDHPDRIGSSHKGREAAMTATCTIMSRRDPCMRPGCCSNFFAIATFPGYFLRYAQRRCRGSDKRFFIIAASKRAIMRKLFSWLAGIATVAIVVIGGTVGAWAERRVALVVGNANYKAANISLANPRNDADDISGVLKALGFEVVTAIDATKRDMDLALQHFARLANDADSALFFYAGHAMQFQGRNFLMPTDAELEDEISVRYQTVGLEEVRTALDRANGVKIMILDAC